MSKLYAYPLPPIKPATTVSSNKYFDIGFDEENDYGFLYYKDADYTKAPIYLESAPRRPNPKITHEFYSFGLMITFDDYKRFYNNKGQDINLPADGVEVFEGSIVYTKDNKTYIYKPEFNETLLVGKRIDNEDGSSVFYFITKADASELSEDDTIELL
ncbi:MAG: hypothetical protein ACLRFL_00995 [Clostridia bacterium]